MSRRPMPIGHRRDARRTPRRNFQRSASDEMPCDGCHLLSALTSCILTPGRSLPTRTTAPPPPSSSMRRAAAGASCAASVSSSASSRSIIGGDGRAQRPRAAADPASWPRIRSSSPRRRRSRRARPNASRWRRSSSSGSSSRRRIRRRRSRPSQLPLARHPTPRQPKAPGDPIIAGFYVNWDDNSTASLGEHADDMDWVVCEWGFVATRAATRSR